MPIMRHPGLPAGQTIDVQDVQVHHYQASGWQIVDDDGPPVEAPASTTEAPAGAGASVLPDQAEDSGSPRRRRAIKAEEE